MKSGLALIDHAHVIATCFPSHIGILYSAQKLKPKCIHAPERRAEQSNVRDYDP